MDDKMASIFDANKKSSRIVVFFFFELSLAQYKHSYSSSYIDVYTYPSRIFSLSLSHSHRRSLFSSIRKNYFHGGFILYNPKVSFCLFNVLNVPRFFFCCTFFFTKFNMLYIIEHIFLFHFSFLSHAFGCDLTE